MAVTFHAASALGGVAVNPPTFNLTLPTLAADDIIVIEVMSKNIAAGNEINTPTGYTEKSTKFNVDGAVAADDMRSAIFYKRAVGGDSGATVTISRAGTSTLGLYGIATVWRGCVTTGDPFDTIQSLGRATLTDNLDFPAIDPVATDVHVVYQGFYADDLTTPAASITNDGTTFTRRIEAETATGTDCTFACYSADRDGAALAAVSAAMVSTDDGSSAAYAFALIPAAGGAPSTSLIHHPSPMLALLVR